MYRCKHFVSCRVEYKHRIPKINNTQRDSFEIFYSAFYGFSTGLSVQSKFLGFFSLELAGFETHAQYVVRLKLINKFLDSKCYRSSIALFVIPIEFPSLNSVSCQWNRLNHFLTLILVTLIAFHDFDSISWSQNHLCFTINPFQERIVPTPILYKFQKIILIVLKILPFPSIKVRIQIENFRNYTSDRKITCGVDVFSGFGQIHSGWYDVVWLVSYWNKVD